MAGTTTQCASEPWPELEVVPAEFPYFPYRVVRCGGSQLYEVVGPQIERGLRLNRQAAATLWLADGEHSLDMIAAQLDESYPESGGVSAVRYQLVTLFEGLTRRGLLWWSKRALRLVPVGSPDTIFWELTAACNLRCRHCVVAGGRREPRELSTARCLELAREMAELGVRRVAFSGGEPLLHPDFRRIAEQARACGLGLRLSTNGTPVTAKLAHWLRERFEDVQVSLDGSTAAIHEALRAQRGSFAAAVRGIRALVAAGLPVTIGCLLSTLNEHNLQALVELAAELGAIRLRPIPFVPSGRGAEHAALELPPARFEALTRCLRDIRASASIEITSLEFEELLDTEACSPPSIRGTSLGCAGARSYATITPIGEVLPCHFFAGVRADSVADESLWSVWDRSRFLNYFRHLSIADLHGACHHCVYLPNCRGGCRASAHAAGELLGDHPGCWVTPRVGNGSVKDG